MRFRTVETPGQTGPGPDIDAFEALDFDVATFDHEAHVHVAWQYLQTCDVLESIDRYRQTLRRLTASIGVPEKYNETITWFFVIAIAERLTPETVTDWAEFKVRNSELFARKPGFLQKFYSEERLSSEMAKKTFLLPDVSTAIECD